MNNHKIFIVGWLILLSTVAGAQKVTSYQSKWRQAALAADEEAMINQMQLDPKAQFMYLITNDDRKMYIDMVVAERNTLQKIMRYGLTTWISREAKHKKELGLEFPVTAEGREEPAMSREKGGDRKEMRDAMLAAKNREMTLIGFDGKGQRTVIDPSKDPGFSGKVTMLEGGRMHISIEVPLDRLGRADVANRALPLGIGFETGYMDVTGQGMPQGGSQAQPGGGMYGGGMYGGPGGGPPAGSTMGTGNAQQDRPDIGKLASPSKLWIKAVTLQQQP